MCGIAGIINFSNQVSLEELRSMTNSINHRGPDGEGHWINLKGRVGLGHRRLSIIDLSEGGNQPMHYLNARYTITFNGEIYNYIELKSELIKIGYNFQSSSDTEVLMALYDCYREECLSYIDGMFAFAIWDEEESKLFCARDRFGEKPFHYFLTDEKFVFASEIKQFKQANIALNINKKRLQDYIAKGIVESGETSTSTFFDNIKKLDAAHYLILQADGKAKIRNYWKIKLSQPTFKGSIEEAASVFYSLFRESIKLRLRSDVPVGSSLSGGLDSSSIVMMIDEIKGSHSQQNTFSARFKDFKKDEGEHIKAVVAKCRNISAHYAWPDRDYLLETFEKVVYHQDEPFGSASIVAQFAVMELAKKNNVPVLLDGQGADEQLGGYLPYYTIYLDELRRNNYELYLKELEAYNKMHSLTLAYEPSRTKETMRMRLGRFRRQIFGQSVQDLTSLRQRLRHDTSENGLKELLRYADRNSMAHSREVRLPFLSHKLVEFVFTLPTGYLLHMGWTKYVLRKSMDQLLPNSICWRVDKVGYEPPQSEWLTSSVFQSSIDRVANDLGIDRKNPGKNYQLNNIEWRLLMASKFI